MGCEQTGVEIMKTLNKKQLLRNNPDCQTVLDLIYQVDGNRPGNQPDIGCLQEYARKQTGMGRYAFFRALKLLHEHGLSNPHDPTRYCSIHAATEEFPRRSKRYVSPGLEKGSLGQDFLKFKNETHVPDYRPNFPSHSNPLPYIVAA